jgi:hypothetical protein
MLIDIFILPPLIIAGMVFVATWNLRDAIIGFRVGFFAWPLFLFSLLGDNQSPGNLILLIAAIVCAVIISRLRRQAPIFFAPPPHSPPLPGQSWSAPPPSPAPRSMPPLVRSAPVKTIPPRISAMQGGELWSRGINGWEMERVNISPDYNPYSGNIFPTVPHEVSHEADFQP